MSRGRKEFIPQYTKLGKRFIDSTSCWPSIEKSIEQPTTMHLFNELGVIYLHSTRRTRVSAAYKGTKSGQENVWLFFLYYNYNNVMNKKKKKK